MPPPMVAPFESAVVRPCAGPLLGRLLEEVERMDEDEDEVVDADAMDGRVEEKVDVFVEVSVPLIVLVLCEEVDCVVDGT